MPPADSMAEVKPKARTSKASKPKAPKPKAPVLRACDQCHLRRVKCSHERPCAHCVRLKMPCTYEHAQKDKVTTGRRIEHLRRIGEPRGPAAPFVEPSQAPQQPGPPAPTFSHLQPSSFATVQSSWPPDDVAGTISLPDFGQSLAEYFNAQPASLRENFLDWDFMLQAQAQLQGQPQQPQQQQQQQSQQVQPLPISDAADTAAPPPPLYTADSALGLIGLGDMLAFDTKGARLFDSLTAPMATAPLGLLDPTPPPATNAPVSLRFDPVHQLVPRASVAEANPPNPSLALVDLDDNVLVPRLGIFFERLQPALPVFKPEWLYARIRTGEHRHDVGLASMLLGMSALVLIQPIEGKEQGTIESNILIAKRLMEDCVRVRTNVLFGKDPSLESIMASFYLFACLFGLRQDNAAWFRLHEAISLGCLLGLPDPASYENLALDEQERRLRAYWLLAITERAYALQRGHSLGFRGHPVQATEVLRAKFQIGEFSDFPGGVLSLFEHVDEHFVDCWNGQCAAKHGLQCNILTATKAEMLAEQFNKGFDPSLVASTVPLSSPSLEAAMGSKYAHSTVQLADVEVTRQWLLNRLWITCLQHHLVSLDAPQRVLRMERAVEIAETTMTIILRLPLSSMEAHGIGLTEKLYDIAVTLTVLYHQIPSLSSSLQAQKYTRPYVGSASHSRSAASQSTSHSHVQPQNVPSSRRRSSHYLSSPLSMVPSAPMAPPPPHGVDAVSGPFHGHAAHLSPSTQSSVSTTSRNGIGISSASSSPASTPFPPLAPLSPGQRGKDWRSCQIMPCNLSILRPGNEWDPSATQLGIEWNATRHPLLLRIPALLRSYLTFFRTFRQGHHPYLPRLIQSIQALAPLADPQAFAVLLAQVGVDPA